jgi:hypothetical protein
MKKNYTARHALRVIKQASTVLGWGKFQVADFLGVTPEAMRLWKTGRTKTTSEETTAKLRLIEKKVKTKRSK